jgi:hypothetical protein
LCPVFDLEIWRAHGDVHVFDFLGAGDNTAIVVGEDHDRFSFKVGAEGAFAGDEEVIAIDEGEEGFHNFIEL